MFDFKKYRIKFAKALLPYSVGIKKFFFMCFSIVAANMIIDLIIPRIYKFFVDKIILQKQMQYLSFVIIAYVLAEIIKICLSYIKLYCSNKLNNSLSLNVKKKIFINFKSLSMPDYTHINIGDQKMKIEDDTSQIASFMNSQLMEYWLCNLTFIITFIILLNINIQLVLLVFITIPITVIIDRRISICEKKENEVIRSKQQQIISWLYNSISNWREIRTLNIQKNIKNGYVKHLEDYAALYVKWINYWTIRVLILPVIRYDLIMRFCVYFFGGILILNNQTSISNLIMFSLYYDVAVASIKTIVNSDLDLNANKPIFDRILEELKRTPCENKVTVNCVDSIVFKNVSYKYPGAAKETIQNISFEIKKGDKVLVSGKSGVGKTTLLNLILGLSKQTSGKIYYSGINSDDIDIDSFYNKVGAIIQNSVLINGSIKENLILGKSDATEKEMCVACEKSNLYDYVANLPQKFDTQIGKNGEKLSGGQRQRLILSRLLMRDYEVYVLDEATSALDSDNECAIQELFNSLDDDKILIVVTHKNKCGLPFNKIIEL